MNIADEVGEKLKKVIEKKSIKSKTIFLIMAIWPDDKVVWEKTILPK